MLAPLLRRTWHPRARTPVLYQAGSHRKKISAIAALCISPERTDVRLYFRLLPDANVNSVAIIGFLQQLRRHIRVPLVVVWDRLNSHISKQTRAFLCRTPNLRTFLFPAYAPELDPVEYAWGYLKNGPLANHAAPDLDALTATTRRHARSVQRRHALLRSFMSHSPLSLRLN